MYAMISRPIKEGFRGVARHWAMSLSSAIAVTVTLIIISIVMILSWHLQLFTKDIESSLSISVLVDYDHESDADKQEIRKALEDIDGVKTVTYRSKEEEFEFYISEFDDDIKEAFEPFRDDNPMHEAFYIETDSGDQIETVAAAAKKIDGVWEVNYGGQTTVDLVMAMMGIRRFGGIFVIALSLLAIFLIQNTIKLTIYARQDEITIMRNVGATNGFIRAPFVWEGIITGILGSIIPIGLTVYLYFLLYQTSHGVLFTNMFKLAAPVPFIYYVSGILLVLGILVGLIGSWLSVTRYLRWKR